MCSIPSLSLDSLFHLVERLLEFGAETGSLSSLGLLVLEIVDELSLLLFELLLLLE